MRIKHHGVTGSTRTSLRPMSPSPRSYRKKPVSTKSTKIHSKFKSHCNTCHYTIWQGELINYNGVATHLDCKSALVDETPRRLDPQYKDIFGKINKEKIKAIIAKKENPRPKAVPVLCTGDTTKEE